MTGKAPKQIPDLVTQLQQAHILAAGFYQRILPQFDWIASDALFNEFWEWNPCETKRPGQQETQPSSRWAWDYLPLFASAHDYRERNDDRAQQGDKALIFRLYIDDDFRKDSSLRARSNGESEPDPLQMSGKAVVEVNLYRCRQSSNTLLSDLIKKAGWPAPQPDHWRQSASCQELEVCSKHLPLAELLADPNKVSEWIKDRSATVQTVTGSGLPS